MFDFLEPKWVVARKNKTSNGFTYLCLFNDNFGAKFAADRFWFKNSALAALSNHFIKNSKYYSETDVERFKVIKDV